MDDDNSFDSGPDSGDSDFGSGNNSSPDVSSNGDAHHGHDSSSSSNEAHTSHSSGHSQGQGDDSFLGALGTYGKRLFDPADPSNYINPVSPLYIGDGDDDKKPERNKKKDGRYAGSFSSRPASYAPPRHQVQEQLAAAKGNVAAAKCAIVLGAAAAGLGGAGLYVSNKQSEAPPPDALVENAPALSSDQDRGFRIPKAVSWTALAAGGAAALGGWLSKRKNEERIEDFERISR